jgi:hypothetical protein
MKRHFGLAAILAVTTTLANGVQAFADGALDLIPADSTVVVRLKNPEQTLVKVAGFANQVKPGIGFLIQSQSQALGVIISNPTMGGVDLKDDWYISVKVNKGDLPHVTFYVPATNVDAMTEAVGDDFSFAMKGNWVAYSEAKAATTAVRECIAKKRKSVGTAMDRRSTALFANSEISAYVNIKNLTGTFSNEIDLADQQLDTLLKQFGGLIPQQPGLNMSAILEIYGEMGHNLIQTARDSEALTVGIGISEDALTFEELLLVTADSQTDKALQKHPTSDLSLLSKLPQNKVAYFAAHGNVQSLLDMGMGFASKMFDDEKVGGKIEKARATMKELKFGEFAGTFELNKEVEDGVFAATALTQVTPAGKMKELMRNMAFEYSMPGMTQKMTLKKDAEKYGDLSADVMITKQTFDEKLDPIGNQQEIIDLINGPDGLVQRTLSTKGTFIQTSGGTQATMKAALAAFNSSEATSSEALTEARGMVLKKANVVVLVDLPNLIIDVLKTAVATGKVPIPIPIDQLPKIDSSYMGFSVGTEAQGVRMKSVISAKSVIGFVKFAEMAQGGGGF